MADERRSDEPFDRLTRLCAEMTDALDGAEENEAGDVKAIVFLDDGERGGIQMHGYEDESEAMAELFVHLQAVFKAQGKRLDLVFADEPRYG